MSSIWRCIKEKNNSRLLGLEAKVEGFFKKDFVGLAGACAVFGKNLEENGSPDRFLSSLDEDNLLKKVEEGCCVLAVPKGVTGKTLCDTGLFKISLSPQEIVRLKMDVLRPGYLFVNKKGPRHISFGMQCMRDSGILKNERGPKLLELMYAYALPHLVNRRKMLVQRICVLCRDEVIRRGRMMPVCFKKNAGTAIEIDAWRSELSLLNVMEISRAC